MKIDKLLPVLLLAMLVTWAPAVWADAYYVETVGIEERSKADSARALAVAEGLQVQVVRGFRKGRGWVWVLRVEDIVGREEAAAEAATLSRITGQAVQVFLVAGKDVLPVEELAVAMPAGEGEPAGGDEDAEAASLAAEATDPVKGAALLAAVVLAHGGRGIVDPARAPFDTDGTNPLHFRFERQADIGQGSMRVWHDYWRSGDDLRVEVRVLEGEGRDSVTVVNGHEGAWLLVDGEVHSVDPGPTREALGVFAPEVVLEQGLALANLQADRRALIVEREAGQLDSTWLELEVQEPDERVYLGVNTADNRVRELVVVGRDGELRWCFGDYQEIGTGLVVPLRLESWYGEQLRESVVVRALEYPESIAGDVFDPGALKKP